MNSLELASINEIRKIAFPSISTGEYSYPLDEAAHAAYQAVKEFTEALPDAFDEIVWVCFDEKTKEAYDKAIKES